MAICKDCIHFKICDKYTAPNESYPEVKGGCPCFKNKADLVEVKHGQWVGIKDFGNGNCIGYCSACGTTQLTQNATELKMFYKYCRWCGAKMDKGGEQNA